MEHFLPARTHWRHDAGIGHGRVPRYGCGGDGISDHGDKCVGIELVDRRRDDDLVWVELCGGEERITDFVQEMK